MRFVSILGDSISTYEGYNPAGYKVYYNSEMQRKNGLVSVYDTWWAKVNQALHAQLCVNNSYSGSRVSGNSFPAATSEKRLSELKFEEYIPDIILIYIGFNDFGYGVPIYSKGFGYGKKQDKMIFEDAYNYMVKEIRKRYRQSTIICGTLMRTRIKDKEDWSFPELRNGFMFENYNDVIRKASKRNGCLLADIGNIYYSYETLDGSHPTVNGHIEIANAWIQYLTNNNI